jgi:hypothetical protein
MRGLIVVAVVASTALAAGPGKPRQADPRSLPGWPIYDRYCLACHGARGDGHGPAAPFTWGRPRAFERGEFEWRTTPLGQPPTEDDLRATIRQGAPGTSMPAFDTLPAGDVDRVIEVIKAFDPSTFALPATPVTLGPARPADVARGEYLWTQLGCDRCHGEHGHGDGPAAKALPEPPYDLVTDPLRRPRASDDPEARRRAAALSIATGMAGTAMPGYAGQVSDADVWALADRVVALGSNAKRTDRSALDVDEIAADRAAPLATGTWPGAREDPEARVFGAPLAAQGTPPASLPPAEASLRSAQCGRCHATELREWQPSRHAGAASVGLLARLDGLAADEVAKCQRCHAPLAEQQSDAELRGEGATCASCHLREWTRRGPPSVSPALLPVPGYPREELAIYERSDFCLPCHQHAPRSAVAGKPLLNTYKEWLEGPYMARGIECQHCHMPSREHTWLGIHDPATFRQGIHLTALANRKGGEVTVVALLRNVGAGHYLPTTPTPAVWLRIELLDAKGHAIAGAQAALRIGRDLTYDGSWHERADTRIPPGEMITLQRTWTAAAATIARVTVEVRPDDFYEGVYATELAGTLAPAVRTLYEQAAARARSSHYIAEQRDVPIALSSGQ